VEIAKENDMSLFEVLYPNRNSLIVKSSPQVKIKTTLIGTFNGTTFLIFQNEAGKLERRDFENLFQAREEVEKLGLRVECEKEFGSPLLQKIEEMKRNYGNGR
jgi:hypothetical protein